MTTPEALRETDVPLDGAATTTSTPTPAHGAAPAAADGLICQAVSVEIGFDGDGTDPFDATFLVAGPDDSGRELAVWMRLTPTVISTLTERLGDVLRSQQEALGVTEQATPAGDDLDAEDTDAAVPRMKRFLDPMGMRHLRARSPRSTVVLAAAIAALLMLAIVVQLVRQ
jgi:hypothetical protein